MSLAKCVIKDLSVEVLEYPEITNPEQALKKLGNEIEHPIGIFPSFLPLKQRKTQYIFICLVCN